MKTESLKPQWLSNVDTDALCGVLFILALPIIFLIGLNAKWDALGLLAQVYLVGVVSYWARWILTVLANCFRLLSVFDRNMAQIGLRRNIFIGTMQETRTMDYSANFVAAAFGIFIASLLSWFVYLVDAYRFVRRRLARWQTPKTIKEFEWVLKNHLLSSLDVVRFDVKMAEALLGRALTQEECDSRQEQLDANGIAIKMTEVIALNNREGQKQSTVE